VRELENLVRVLLVECEHDDVGLNDLPARLRQAGATEATLRRPDWTGLNYQSALHATVAGFEEEFLRYHLAKNQGNISKTALAIGLSRVALHKKINQYRIEP
jgi:DNA-binding NtrC family response regulator